MRAGIPRGARSPAADAFAEGTGRRDESGVAAASIHNRLDAIRSPRTEETLDGLRTRAAECHEARARQHRRFDLLKSRAIPDQRSRLAFVGSLRAAIGHAARRRSVNLP
jgi:hypothetical protein